MTESPDRISAIATQPRYLAILAASAAAILLVGSLLRPRADEPSAPPQMPESELARLRQASQRQSLLDETSFFRSVSDEIGPAVSYLAAHDRSAVAWSATRMVTTRLLPVSSETQSLSTAVGPRTRPVIPVEMAPLSVSIPARADNAVRAGDWVLAVWNTAAERAFVPGRYMGATAVSCGTSPAREVLTTLPLQPGMAGAGLFDVYGSLVGLVVPCDGRLAAVAATSVDAMLADAASVSGRLLDLYGLEAATPTDREAAYFGVAEGAIVRAVWEGEIADTSGLIPGDVIVAIDDTPVASFDDLAGLTADAPPVSPRLTVSRNGAPVQLTLGLTVDEPETETAETARVSGLAVENVPAESPAAAAVLRPGDRLIRIDRQVVGNPGQVERLLSSPVTSDLFIEVSRDGRRWGVLLP